MKKSGLKWVYWLSALALLIVLQAVLRDWIGAYYYQILILVGINIILSVSLNLINGFTGQFSIGHAGFYAVGAYTSAAVVVYSLSFHFGLRWDRTRLYCFWACSRPA